MLGDLVLGAVRLAHALAAALWVGGTLVFALFPIGAAADGGNRFATQRYRQLLRAGIGVFVLSGALLSVERLGSAPLPPSYFAILIVKVALGIWMFSVARHVGSTRLHSRGNWSRPELRVVALGVAIYALAIALRAIYDGVVRA